MSQLPVTQHPKLKAIWEHLYLISLPEMYLRSEDDIRARGTTTTGDPQLDAVMHSRYSKAYRTINQMFELHRQGVNIYVVKYEDTEKIYNAIQAHLSIWFNYMSLGLNLYNAPFDDLLDLDKFANVVYDKAKFVFDDAALNTLKGAWNTLGIDLTPATFMMGRNRPRFAHSFKTDAEKRLESSDYQRAMSERQGYGEEMMKVASRYDFRLKNQKPDQKPEVEKLSIDLRFANEK